MKIADEQPFELKGNPKLKFIRIVTPTILGMLTVLGLFWLEGTVQEFSTSIKPDFYDDTPVPLSFIIQFIVVSTILAILFQIYVLLPFYDRLIRSKNNTMKMGLVAVGISLLAGLLFLFIIHERKFGNEDILLTFLLVVETMMIYSAVNIITLTFIDKIFLKPNT